MVIAAGTRRGLKARARGARATGGLAYGYTTEPSAEGGKRIVVKLAEAAVVRRIFERYAEGQGLKALAYELNAERVPAPTPRGVRAKEGAPPSWAPTSLREMLRNDLYRGRLVYNRSRWMRQRNGKRKRFDRPREEWIVQEVPELRIVSDDAWNAAQEAIARRMGPDGRPAYQRAGGNRRRFLLAGVLRCGKCGLSFCSAGGSGHLACSGRRARGTCDVALRVKHDDVAARILDALEAKLLTPDAVARIIEKAAALVEAALEHGDHDRDREQLTAIDRKIRRKTEAFEDEDDDVSAARMRRELQALRDERRVLRERVAAAGAGARLDAAAIRARFAEMAQDVRGRAVADAVLGREAILELIAEDAHGHHRLDVIEDATAPGGYRIEGTLRLPIAINTASSETKSAGQAEPDRRLRRMVAGGCNARVSRAVPFVLPVAGRAAA